MANTSYSELAREEVRRGNSGFKRTSVELKRATYYLRPDQIKALKLRAVLEDENISAIVRQALDHHLNPNKAKKEYKTRSVQPKNDYLFVSNS